MLHNIEDKRTLDCVASSIDCDKSGSVAMAASSVVDSNTDASQQQSPSTSRATNNIVHSKTFQGGSFRDLHQMLGITYGDRVLYVGDHMFADVVK